jgi:hypothetical protein
MTKTYSPARRSQATANSCATEKTRKGAVPSAVKRHVDQTTRVIYDSPLPGRHLSDSEIREMANAG